MVCLFCLKPAQARKPLEEYKADVNGHLLDLAIHGASDLELRRWFSIKALAVQKMRTGVCC